MPAFDLPFALLYSLPLARDCVASRIVLVQLAFASLMVSVTLQRLHLSQDAILRELDAAGGVAREMKLAGLEERLKAYADLAASTAAQAALNASSQLQELSTLINVQAGVIGELTTRISQLENTTVTTVRRAGRSGIMKKKERITEVLWFPLVDYREDLRKEQKREKLMCRPTTAG